MSKKLVIILSFLFALGCDNKEPYAEKEFNISNDSIEDSLYVLNKYRKVGRQVLDIWGYINGKGFLLYSTGYLNNKVHYDTIFLENKINKHFSYSGYMDTLYIKYIPVSDDVTGHIILNYNSW